LHPHGPYPLFLPPSPVMRMAPPRQPTASIQ
jgi:hypothetical protein